LTTIPPVTTVAVSAAALFDNCTGCRSAILFL
jgi:hypothetical protein